MHPADIPTSRHTSISNLITRLQPYRRILLWGEPGAGKSTLAVELLQQMESKGQAGLLLELDPGTPPFGVPGTVGAGRIHAGKLLIAQMLPLCTLDSLRFRLPLLEAARELLLTYQHLDEDATLLIDPPGVIRGVGGAELMMALVQSLSVDAIAVLAGTGELPQRNELQALARPVVPVAISPAAKKLTATAKARQRTALWDDFLTRAKDEEYDLQHLCCIGTPPPSDSPDGWRGKQVALLDDAGKVVAMGEVLGLDPNLLSARMVRSSPARGTTLLIRDCGRNEAGSLVTIAPLVSSQTTRHVPGDMGTAFRTTGHLSPPVSCNLGVAWATLIGGVFGDPLLHVRLRNQKRSFLFDLGASSRLPARIAHQVEAVFLSHTHLDHIAGFIWFLRSRLGPFGPSRIFGPAGTIERLEHFLNAITWDRIDDTGPLFVVTEIGDAELAQVQMQPGRKSMCLGSRPVDNGIILADDTLRVRAAICDHNIPSIAYALEFHQGISIRKDRLRLLNLPPGPWLGKLKQSIAQKASTALIDLPDGSKRLAGELAAELTIITPGKKLVYIADMADNEENRRKVVHLAHDAHTVFCEAAFTSADQDKAMATQHLTTIAAAQIANTAGVKQLVPFHFSKRYEHRPHALYEEISREAGNVRVVAGMPGRLSGPWTAS